MVGKEPGKEEPYEVKIRTYNEAVYKKLQEIAGEFFKNIEIVDPHQVEDPQQPAKIVHGQNEIQISQQAKELKKFLGKSTYSKHKLEDVVGLTKAKEKLKYFTQYKQVKKVDKIIGPVEIKGYVLYGPPGVGKNYLYEAVINEAEANGIKIGSTTISVPTHGSKYVFGASNNILEEYLNVVRRLKKNKTTHLELIFLDEVEGLVTDREQEDNHTAYKQVVNTFNQIIDGEFACDGVFFIGCSNHIKGLDTSFIRSGRLEPIPCDYPTKKELHELFGKYHKKVNKSSNVNLFGKLNLNELTELGFQKKFSGADVNKIFNNAKERIRREMIDEKLALPKSKITQKNLVYLIKNFDMLQKGEKFKTNPIGMNRDF